MTYLRCLGLFLWRTGLYGDFSMQSEMRRGLKLYMSNNMESLGDICAILMSEYPLKSPFDHENIVVMNLGMRTYVTQRIALQNGIHTLCDFKQIWQLIFAAHRILNQSKGEEFTSLNLFDRSHLTWNIFTQMGLWQEQKRAAQAAGQDLSSGPEPIYARLFQYLEDDSYGDKAYELAAKIADTLDSYQMYRPEWILAWDKIPLQALVDYERDPDDPNNPINQFIEGECQRFMRMKAGLKPKSTPTEVTAASAEMVNLGTEVDALALKESLEDEALAERVTRERVERVRTLFKNNVWQIKLWCLLRYNYSFNSEQGLSLKDKTPASFDWLLRNLDRAQVVTNLIAKLKALAPKFNEDTGELVARRYDASDPEVCAAFVDATELRQAQEAVKALADSYQRIFVFGVSAMPRLVVDFLDALALHCDVNVMLLNPCQEYWADLRVDEKFKFEEYVKLIQGSSKSAHDLALERPQLSAVGRKGKKSSYLPLSLKSLVPNAYDAAGERIEGHPLLLSYGKQGRDNLYLFYDRDPVPANIACFSEPDLPDGGDFSETWVLRHNRKVKEVRGGTLLTFLQHQLLNLEQPKERYIIAPHDVSLSVHSCHTKRREVEVLHDAILACFNRARQEGRPLYPRDIVVMVPTINDYAPHISAVFGGQFKPGDPDYIPFVISDRTESEANSVAQSLLKLLEIGTVRITSVLVAELLSENAIARRFGLSRDQVDVIVRWLKATNIYWGLDAHDVSPVAEIVIPGTFSLGLERMILGALMGDTSLPCWSEIEGSDTIILGKFWDFLQALRELRARFVPELALTPDMWALELNNMIKERFFDDAPETEQALRGVDEVIDDLKVTITHLFHKPSINLPVFAACLRQGLTAQRNFQPFLREKVNFCSLVPMRAVPFKHVFILGLNDIDFPREEKAPSFNLIANKELFRRGDRSRSIDDRYLFLEAIISARESIYFSYIGQSPNDKSPLNPSIVLSELIYFLGDSCAVAGLEDITESERPDSVRTRLCYHEHLTAYDELNFHAANYPDALPTSEQDLNATVAAYHKRLGHKGMGSDLEQYRAALQSLPPQVPSFSREFIALRNNSLKTPREILGNGVFKPDMSGRTRQLIELNQLLAFMREPSRYFMRNVLEISLGHSDDNTLSPDEPFAYDNFESNCLVSALMALPPAERGPYLKREADLGHLPYGLFFNELKTQINSKLELLSSTLQSEFGLAHSALIGLKDCPNTQWFLTLPKAFFETTAPFDFWQVGADLTKMQFEPSYVPSWLKDVAPDAVYHFDLTLQSSCHERPIVLALFNKLSSSGVKNSFDGQGNKLTCCEAAASKPKVVYSALAEMIGQYCSDGYLSDVYVVESEGKVFTLKAFSEPELRTLINTYLVCYLVSQSRPLPLAASITTALQWNKDGERVPPESAIAYDSESEYLFASLDDLARYPELYDCAWFYRDFYLQHLASHFVFGADAQD